MAKYKKDLALNNLQGLIHHKIQLISHPTNLYMHTGW